MSRDARTVAAAGFVEQEHLLAFANLCQVLAIRLQTTTSREEAVRLLSRFVHEISTPSTALSNAIVWNLVTEFLLRLRTHLRAAAPVLRTLLPQAANANGGRSPYGGLAAVIDSVAGNEHEPVAALPNLAATPRGAVRRNARLQAALAFIEQQSAKPRVRLDDAARFAGLSRWHLERLIKRHTGSTFRESVRAIRRRRIEHLLAHTAYSIKQIAAECGYANVSTLDRDFRRSHDCTPRDWRDRHHTRLIT